MAKNEKRKNKFKWEISINSMDSLHKLYQILLFYLRDHDNVADNLSLMITLEEGVDESLHREIKEFVDTRETHSYLTVLTDNEEAALFRFPKQGSNEDEGFVDRRKKNLV